jgi:hypothetical protein
MMFAYLETLRNTAELSQQRVISHKRHYITVTSENYGGSKEISFASLTVQGSIYFTQLRVFLLSARSMFAFLANIVLRNNCTSVQKKKKRIVDL